MEPRFPGACVELKILGKIAGVYFWFWPWKVCTKVLTIKSLYQKGYKFKNACVAPHKNEISSSCIIDTVKLYKLYIAELKFPTRIQKKARNEHGVGIERLQINWEWNLKQACAPWELNDLKQIKKF